MADRLDDLIPRSAAKSFLAVTWPSRAVRPARSADGATGPARALRVSRPSDVRLADKPVSIAVFP